MGQKLIHGNTEVDCKFKNHNPKKYKIDVDDGNTTYTVYSQYRIVGQPGRSPIGSASIALNETLPTATLNSPAGILNPDSADQLAQAEFINATVGQWITGSAAAAPEGEPLLPLGTPPGPIEAAYCQTPSTPSSCTTLPSSPNDAWPTNLLLWSAQTAGDVTNYPSASIIATDEAGNQFATTPAVTTSTVAAALSLFDPTTTNLSLTCYPPGGTGACTPLADAVDSDYDIPGDPPSNTVAPTTICGGSQSVYFTGYADPSMRADPAVPTDGPNLWMLYSYPLLWATNHVTNTQYCANTPAVETHLASSESAPPYDGEGGQNWGVWCTAGDDCTSPTPIWPSEPYCASGSVGTSPTPTTCTSTCSLGGTCFSSHEVPNFWPDTTVFGTETWFAAHLMYYVPVGNPIVESTLAKGCLVLSMAATSPSNLGWAMGSGPLMGSSSDPCGATFPSCIPGSCSLPLSTNAPVSFATLTALASQGSDGSSPPCDSWGEPAVMVAPQPPSSVSQGGTAQPALWMAASCLTYQGIGSYYIFWSQGFSATSQGPALGGWSWDYYSGPWTPSNLPTASITPAGNQPINSLTELDWAVRADSTVVAVVTPQYVVDGTHSGTPMQYGCVAVNFSLLSTTNPFAAVAAASGLYPLATVNDMDGSPSTQGAWEQWGTAGCTYDPMSNTGIVVVRHLLDSYDCSNPVQCQQFSIEDTGVLP